MSRQIWEPQYYKPQSIGLDPSGSTGSKEKVFLDFPGLLTSNGISVFPSTL